MHADEGRVDASGYWGIVEPIAEEVMSENNKSQAPDTENRAEDTGKLSKDTQRLGPMHFGRFVVGAVDRIVGEGGIEVPGFVVTKNELLQLVRYWATEIIDLDFFYSITTGAVRVERPVLKSIHADPTGTEKACYDSLVEHIGVNSNLLLIVVRGYCQAAAGCGATFEYPFYGPKAGIEPR